MDIIAEYTPYVASLSKYNGDSAPYTAKGILRGIQAAVAYKLSKDSLSGLHIAIQGLGHVGYTLAKSLYEQGVNLSVADIYPDVVEQAVKEFNAKPVSTENIHKVPCDVFAPCALGAILNDSTIAQLRTRIVAGAANNQLAHAYHGKILHDLGILYVPDYVINAGGLIFAAAKYFQTSDEGVAKQLDNIQIHLLEIFTRSAKENSPPIEIADKMAQEKLANYKN